VQDADNLGWKLDLVHKGLADAELLDSYDAEREYAADENILNSSRATDFMTPKSGASRTFRDAVLALVGRHVFARPFVNSGRLSVPCNYEGFPLFGPDRLNCPAATRPGACCPDAPVEAGYLLGLLVGRFTLLAIGDTEEVGAITSAGIETAVARIPEPSPGLRARYLGAAPGAVYLIRPDQHIVARWASYDPDATAAALRQAIGKA
jgi:3-(3-hydroxy-phenyl)propionate hydroxylase